MAAALSPDMLATDLAYYLARKGVRTPFCVQERSLSLALAGSSHQEKKNKVDHYLYVSHIRL